jgi:hypothetical protein
MGFAHCGVRQLQNWHTTRNDSNSFAVVDRHFSDAEHVSISLSLVGSALA